MSHEAYFREKHHRKAKAFFLKVLKNDCQHLTSPDTRELLADTLASRLIEKLERERKKK